MPELLRQWETLPQDTHRVRLLRQLGSHYLERNTDSAQVFVQEMKSLSEELDFPKGLVWSNVLMAGLLNKREQETLSLALLRESLTLARQHLLYPEIALVERNLSNHYRRAGRVDEARRHLANAALALDKMEDRTMDPQLVLSMAFLYQQYEDYPSAHQLYRELETGLRGKPGSETDLAMALANHGHLYSRLGSCDTALVLLKESLSMIEGNYGGLAFVNAIIGGCYRKLNQPALALQYHLDSYQAALRQKSPTSVAEAASDVSLAYEMAGNPTEALRYLRIKTNLNDSLRSDMFDKRVAVLESDFEAKRLEQAAREAEMKARMEQMEQVERQRWVVAGLLGSFLSLLVIAFVISRQSRQRKALNTQLESVVEERTSDLSELNQRLLAEVEERKRSETELNTFVYRSSHDIKGPLTSIKGLINILEEDIDRQEAASYLGMIRHKTEHLDEVLERLIEHVRLSERELQPVEVHPRKVYKEALAALEDQAGFAEVAFDWGQQPVESTLVLDRECLFIVFRNLLSNAIHFRDPEKGMSFCRVKVSVEENGCAIKVVDNGIGMTSELQEKVRQMFFRGSLKSKGTGLGLFVVEKIVRRMQGHMELESVEGEGTTFSVWIPSIPSGRTPGA